MNLSPLDTTVIHDRLPKEVTRLLERHPQWILAGGFIRASIAREPTNDIDLFCIGDFKPDEVMSEFIDWKRSDTANAITLARKGTWPVQLIKRWRFGAREAVLDHFDLTIAQASFGSIEGKWSGLCSDTFYADLAARRLVYTWPTDPEPGGSLLRVLKFVKRGYAPSLDCLAGIVSRLSLLAENDDERERAKLLTAKLLEVDPHGFVASGDDVIANLLRESTEDLPQ